MQCNVGGADRAVRLGFGAALLGAGSFAEMSARVRLASFLAGAIAVGTASIRYCPASALLGVNTCRQAA